MTGTESCSGPAGPRMRKVGTVFHSQQARSVCAEIMLKTKKMERDDDSKNVISLQSINPRLQRGRHGGTRLRASSLHRECPAARGRSAFQSAPASSRRVKA